MAAESDYEGSYEQLIVAQNRKKKKAGGFQAMGFDNKIWRGIQAKGYRIPTPIQRKAIPLILSGKDVVAMARTGSGKTAAFLLPMLQKLKAHQPQSSARALLISPTRELALQTFKFMKELGKYTGLRAALLVGGDSMDDQFATIHEHPDIIIATPGRLLHIVVEMNLKLKSIEYVVFDEADRLFELGFEQQLLDVLSRLPNNRQTLLFSATVPKTLVDFAKAGLTDPVLVRLDTDTKISDKLEMQFLYCVSEDKLAVLLHILCNVMKPAEQVVVFCATKHEVEYFREVFELANISCTSLYSTMDSDARKINIDKFRNKKARVLVVTDLAARGVDLPLLDTVINLRFPAKPKLYVHRVGRVARAGRAGKAISLLASDELPYLLDLYTFLGRELKFSRRGETSTDGSDTLFGVPQSVIDNEATSVQHIFEKSADLEGLKKTAENAYKHYIRSRPVASCESYSRTKAVSLNQLAVHPNFGGAEASAEEQKRSSLLDGLKQYRPQATVFELNTNHKNQGCSIMKSKRKAHAKYLKRSVLSESAPENATLPRKPEVEATSESLMEVFKSSSGPKSSKHTSRKSNSDYFVPYQPFDFHSEKGLSVDKQGNSLLDASRSAVVDFTMDDTEENQRQSKRQKWDRKRKRFVSATGSETVKKIRTESGVLIPASYKAGTYDQWKRKHRVNEQEDTGGEAAGHLHNNRCRHNRRGGNNRNDQQKRNRHELKSSAEILKQRQRKEKLQNHQKRRQHERSKHSKRVK